MVVMQKGFTLIELMIVIIIIGVLIGVGLPMYQGYVAESQMTRVAAELSSRKPIIEAALLKGRTLTLGSRAPTGDNSEALGFYDEELAAGGQPTTQPVSELLSAVALTGFVSGSDTNELTATLGRSASSDLGNTTITLSRTGTGIWRCLIANMGSAWKDSYAPANCEVSGGGA
ncbi:pilin [Neisseria leonii]|uniref:pilin n=1 Tax=Neisseria leonii TaxID=2995413 RepID=UPI0030CED219